MDSFVRLCVPLTVSAEDSPDVHEDVLPQSQLSWGGDSNTDWRGTAEPKGAKHAECSAIDGAVSSTMPALPFNLKRCGCTGAPHGQWKKDQRSIRLTSYLLLPDWLPLCLWFEREFEPCVAGDDKSGVRGIDAAVMAAGDWANVWSQLRDMFLQVVSGVEFLHERGVVHNNLHLESVWVSRSVSRRHVTWSLFSLAYWFVFSLTCRRYVATAIVSCRVVLLEAFGRFFALRIIGMTVFCTIRDGC